MVLQIPDAGKEGVLEVSFCNVEALEFVHGFDLLFSLDSGIVEGLVLLFDPGNFLLDLLFPIVSLSLFPFLALIFELANFVQFSFFFHL